MAQAPSLYNIETGLPFVDALAAGLIERLGGEGDPLALARAQVLLPNRRACRALADAFLRLSRGRPAVLPRKTQDRTVSSAWRMPCTPPPCEPAALPSKVQSAASRWL